MEEWRSCKWRIGGGMTNGEFREVLEARTTKLAIGVFQLLRKLPYDVSVKIIAYQLGKSASSIGANYHEANRSESRDDFIHKISIALKESNESCYWFKVLKGLFGEQADIDALSKETVEIRNLLQSILHSARSRRASTSSTPPLTNS